MTEFYPFEIERLMSEHEQRVDYNLSERGVHPVSVRELLANHTDEMDALLELELNYPRVNGTTELRENIASLYEGATPDNVLVTVGAAEANYLTVTSLLQPGDEIVVMLPNYMQVWGIAKNHGMRPKPFNLVEERDWAPDLDELEQAVTDRTRMIAVCNPNNPTGRILTEVEMEAVINAADRCGAWLLADEVYAGAERLSDETTPSFYGRYDKVIAMGSLSKAYGLPGLHIGWAAGPPVALEQMWMRHEYTAISASIVANRLATIALSPDVRPRILQRTRDYIRRGYPNFEKWMQAHHGHFRLTPPQAAAIAFVRYDYPMNSTELVHRLIAQQSVLIVPGDHFGRDHHLRISFGLPPAHLTAGLDRINRFLEQVAA